MARLLPLKKIQDKRGSLTVLDNIERLLPFPVRRIFYIQQATGTRGGHRHHYTRHAVICLTGSCIVSISDGKKEENFLLDNPHQCLIIETSDWHTMHHFSEGTILLALASTVYDANDYIYPPYEKVGVNDTV
jgi:dTDP-4-dehydrorhamnose 3,5-epimerase-like enzyme